MIHNQINQNDKREQKPTNVCERTSIDPDATIQQLVKSFVESRDRVSINPYVTTGQKQGLPIESQGEINPQDVPFVNESKGR